MFEQDYIIRLIKEMIRAVLKLLFNIDTQSPAADLLERAEEKAALEALQDMIDEGRIDEADAFWEEHHFSRNEVKQGLMDIVSRYGLDSISETFLQ